MTKLEDKVSDVLARLATLTEAPAGNVEAQIARSAPESSLPQGSTLRLDPDRPPPKDRSLHDWYLWHFVRHAGDPDRLDSLRILAEREYKRRTQSTEHQKTLHSGAWLHLHRKGDKVEDEEADRVVDWYEGVHARDVAVIEDITESWVRKIRLQRNRYPDDGRPRPEFYDWPEKRRRATIARLAGELPSKQAVADHLGVDRMTVSRYWPKHRRMAAA